jgi:hypothetical protein
MLAGKETSRDAKLGARSRSQEIKMTNQTRRVVEPCFDTCIQTESLMRGSEERHAVRRHLGSILGDKGREIYG